MQIICERSNEKGRGEKGLVATRRSAALRSRSASTRLTTGKQDTCSRGRRLGRRSRRARRGQASPQLRTRGAAQRGGGVPKTHSGLASCPRDTCQRTQRQGNSAENQPSQGASLAERARGLRLTPPTTTAGDQTNGRPRALRVGALRAHTPAAASPSRFAPAALQTPRPSCSSQKAKEIHYSRTLTRHNLKKLGRYS